MVAVGRRSESEIRMGIQVCLEYDPQYRGSLNRVTSALAHPAETDRAYGARRLPNFLVRFSVGKWSDDDVVTSIAAIILLT